MFFYPPAVIVIPLATREQLQQMVTYVISRLRQLDVAVKHTHSDGAMYLQCRNTRDGLLERVDVYLASGDYANVLPAREEIRENYIERVGYVHLVQGVAILFRYKAIGEPKLEVVEVYTAGSVYRNIENIFK